MRKDCDKNNTNKMMTITAIKYHGLVLIRMYRFITVVISSLLALDGSISMYNKYYVIFKKENEKQ